MPAKVLLRVTAVIYMAPGWQFLACAFLLLTWPLSRHCPAWRDRLAVRIARPMRRCTDWQGRIYWRDLHTNKVVKYGA